MDEISVLDAAFERLTTYQLALFSALLSTSEHFSSHSALLETATAESYSATTTITTRLPLKGTHAQLAKACLSYLLLSDFAEASRPALVPVESLSVLFEQYPLFQYCAKYCMGHIRASRDLYQNYWPTIVTFLHQPNANFSYWWAVVNGAPKSPDEPPLSPSALHVCARYGLDDVVKRILLLQDFPNLMPSGIDARDDRGDTAMMRAAMWGHSFVVEILVHHGSEIDAVNNDGWRALMFACGNQNIEMVSLLLRLGSKLSGLQEDRKCPLAIAAFTANKEIFDKLREGGFAESDRIVAMLESLRGGNVDITRVLWRSSDLQKLSGLTCVSIAVECGHIPMVEFLVSQGISLISPRERWDSPLHVAARRGRISMVEFLISQGCEFQQRNLTGDTPLISALRARNGEVAQIIAKKMRGPVLRKTLDAVADDSSNALNMAYEQNDMSTLQCLLDCGADADIGATSQDSTLLVVAIQQQNIAAVHMLLQSEARVDIKIHTGETPLHLAASQGNIRILEDVMEVIADKNIRTTDGLTPTHIAAREGHSSVIDILVKNGAIIGLTDHAGNMEIHFASMTNHVAIVKAMLKYGQLPETDGGAGLNALHIVSMAGFSECVELFLQNMAPRNVSLDMADPDGYSALNHAAFGNHADAVRLLLAYGANINHATLLGYSPLHTAVKRNNIDIVRQLLEHSADVNTQAFDGSTSLIGAAAEWRPELVNILLEHGANPFVCDNFGRSSWNWASNSRSILGILSQFDLESTIDQHVPLTSFDHMARDTADFLLNICSPFSSTLRFKTMQILLSVLTDIEMLRQNFGNATTLMEHATSIAKGRDGTDFSRTPCRSCHSQNYVVYFRCQSCLPILLCDTCHSSYVNGFAVETCLGHEMLRIPEKGQLGSSAGVFDAEHSTLDEWVRWVSTEIPNRDISSHPPNAASIRLGQNDPPDVMKLVNSQETATSSSEPPDILPHLLFGDSVAVNMNERKTVDELSSGIMAFRNEIVIAKACHSPSIIKQMQLCILTLRKAEESRDIDDLMHAVAAADEALEEETTDEQRNAITVLLSFGIYRLAEVSQRIEDFDRGIQVMQQAIACTPPGSLESLMYHIFSDMCRSRYDKSKSTMSNIESKIQIITTAGTKVNDSTFHTFQKMLLSDLYSLLYDRCGSADALAAAIGNLNQAIGLNEEQTREEFPDRYEDLYSLYDTSYELSGSLQTLDRAIEALRTYLEAIRKRNRGVANAVGLNNLAAALLEKTHHKRNTDTSSAAIVCEAEGLALEAFEIMRQYDDRPAIENVRGEMLTNLGNAYQRKFELLGNMKDLDAMAHYHKESLQKPTDPNQRATRLSNLGLAYKMRYVQTLELADLEMGMDLATQAVETKNVLKDTKSYCLQGLTELYKQQCIRLPHSRHHLDLAIRLSKIALCSAQKASRILFCRETLLNLLGLRFDRYGETRDAKATLTLALRSYFQCMREFRTEEASGQLSVIGNVYMRRSDDSEKTWNLTMAVKFHKFALKLSPVLSADVPLVNLAAAYMKRHSNLTSPDDLPRAIQISEVVARLPNAPLFIRLRCTRSAARLSMHIEDWGNATRLWLQLLRHLPIVTTKFKSHTDMQHVLGLLSGVADWAASAFINDGKMTPAEILALMEGSRGQIARAVIESRGPILVDQVESPLKNLITTDMSQEGMGDEHLPSPERQANYKTLARHKYIVSFAITKHRSDAFIISPGADIVRQIQLPYLDLNDVESVVQSLIGGQRLSRGDKSTRAARNHKFDKILKWLWDVAVRPVLVELKLMDLDLRQVERLPRVCWITSGIFGLMPLHAAGVHSPTSRENTLSRVVSSYASSLRSLEFASERMALVKLNEKPNMLIVSAPSAPGFDVLETEAEVAAVEGSFATSHTETYPSRSSLIDRLKSSNIAHFVCHGEMEPRDPSKACLLLGGGSTGRDRFTVTDLLEIQIPNSSLAYLSACSTAENSAENLVDEVLHLASGFQLAGFPHVVGAMWEAHNEASVHIARAFYGRTTSSWGDREHLSENIAYALHDAILSCKEKYAADALAWAPFIHLGP